MKLWISYAPAKEAFLCSMAYFINCYYDKNLTGCFFFSTFRQALCKDGNFC